MFKAQSMEGTFGPFVIRVGPSGMRENPVSATIQFNNNGGSAYSGSDALVVADGALMALEMQLEAALKDIRTYRQRG